MEREGREKAKRKEINWGFIRKNRSWPEVEDILKLKMRYIGVEEEAKRTKYNEKKRKLLKWCKKKKRTRKYR